jgi:hypothetical protein
VRASSSEEPDAAPSRQPGQTAGIKQDPELPEFSDSAGSNENSPRQAERLTLKETPAAFLAGASGFGLGFVATPLLLVSGFSLPFVVTVNLLISFATRFSDVARARVDHVAAGDGPRWRCGASVGRVGRTRCG